MAKSVKIYERACSVIYNCTDLKHIAMLRSYIELAKKQILKKKSNNNYEYVAFIDDTLQWKCQDLINQYVFKREELVLLND